ncbi:hypothetical protein BH09ACT10_BH09ACT10_01220 [soil metagenome]
MKFTRLALVTAISGALLLSACSSSDSDGGSGGESDKGGVSAADVSTALTYVGGKEGKADSSLAPFTIGFVNGQGAVPSFPEQEKAADAAVDFINSKLGGVGGHPVELEKCFIQAEEDGQKCAGQLLDAKVNIANVGVTVFGNATLYKLIGDKFPTIVTAAVTGPDATTKGVYAMDGGSLTNLAALADIAQNKGFKKLSIISSNNPAAKYLMSEIILPDIKARGIEATTVYLADTATTPDYVSALQTSGAAKSDAVYLLPATVAGCVSLYDGMKQISLTKPVLGPSQCGNDPMPEKTGGGPEGWSLAGLNDPVFLDSPEAKTVSDVMDAAGSGSVKNVGFAAKGFGDILTITKFANAIGFDKLTPAAFNEQIASFAGPAWMIPGTIKCGANTTQIGLCGDSASVYGFEGGKWVAGTPFKP